MKRISPVVLALAALLLLLFLPAGSPADGRNGCEHQWELIKTVEPTCTKSGKKVWQCSLCGQEKTEKLDALGHDWAYCRIVKKATCTKDGLKECTCSRNPEHVKKEKIPAKGHQWGNWITVRKSTASENGLQKRTCSVCSKTEERKLPLLAAEWQSPADPSVTEELRELFGCAFGSDGSIRYEPVAFLASRSADGTDRCFLAMASESGTEVRPWYVYVFLHEDSSGRLRVTNLVRLNLGM